MRKTGNTKYNKMLMLIAALMMVLFLSGCRTRMTNNTEVASTINDEDGWIRETYEMRREDLEMPVAKKPFILGSKDEELDGYDDEYESDYDFDSAIDREVEEEDIDSSDDSSSDTSTSTQTTSSSSSTTTRRTTSSSTVRRRTTTPKRKTTTTKKKTTTKTNTNTKKTDPPKEEQQQQQQEEPKKQYTISFDGNGVEMDGATITVEEGGTYGSLPDPPSRDDYTFDGWYTDKEDGTKVQEGDKIASDGDHTLYAHWKEVEKDPAKEWGDRFDIAANEQVDKLDCMLLPDEKNKKTVEDCKGNIVAADGSPKCIIVFASDEDDVSDAAAQTIFEENAAVNPALEKVIIIRDSSINSSDDKQQLFYKLVLLDAMHGKLGQDELDKAVAELGIGEYVIGKYSPVP